MHEWQKMPVKVLVRICGPVKKTDLVKWLAVVAWPGIENRVFVGNTVPVKKRKKGINRLIGLLGEIV
jgi:hypothetical protein